MVVDGAPSVTLTVGERALADRERVLGADHPDTLTAFVDLARSYAHAGRTEEATALLERVVAERDVDPDRRDTMETCVALADVYWKTGRFEDATALLERVPASSERELGDDHADTLALLDLLRVLRRARKRRWWRWPFMRPTSGREENRNTVLRWIRSPSVDKRSAE